MDTISVGCRPYVFVRGGSLEKSISAIYCSPSVKTLLAKHDWTKISEYNLYTGLRWDEEF